MNDLIFARSCCAVCILFISFYQNYSLYLFFFLLCIGWGVDRERQGCIWTQASKQSWSLIHLFPPHILMIIVFKHGPVKLKSRWLCSFVRMYAIPPTQKVFNVPCVFIKKKKTSYNTNGPMREVGQNSSPAQWQSRSHPHCMGKKKNLSTFMKSHVVSHCENVWAFFFFVISSHQWELLAHGRGRGGRAVCTRRVQQLQPALVPAGKVCLYVCFECFRNEWNVFMCHGKPEGEFVKT